MGHCRRIDGSGSCRVEEERHGQAWRLPEFETEEEASNSSTQGRQPLHQGAMRVQGKAGLQDRACIGHEEVEGDGELGYNFCTFGSLRNLGGRTRWIDLEVSDLTFEIRVGGLAGSLMSDIHFCIVFSSVEICRFG